MDFTKQNFTIALAAKVVLILQHRLKDFKATLKSKAARGCENGFTRIVY